MGVEGTRVRIQFGSVEAEQVGADEAEPGEGAKVGTCGGRPLRQSGELLRRLDQLIGLSSANL